MMEVQQHVAYAGQVLIADKSTFLALTCLTAYTQAPSSRA